MLQSFAIFFPGKGQPSSLIPEADADNIETDTTWQCIITRNNFPGCKQHVSPLECGKQLCRPYVIAQLVNCQDPWDAAQALLIISVVTFNYPLMSFYNKSGNKRYAGDRRNAARSRAQMIHVHHSSLNGMKQTDDGFLRRLGCRVNGFKIWQRHGETDHSLKLQTRQRKTDALRGSQHFSF